MIHRWRTTPPSLPHQGSSSGKLATRTGASHPGGVGVSRVHPPSTLSKGPVHSHDTRFRSSVRGLNEGNTWRLFIGCER